jgi:hypothetical protein
MSYGLSHERPAALVVGANYLKNGEPAGTRTQDPRLKRAMLYQLSYRLTEECADCITAFSLCLDRSMNRLACTWADFKWVTKNNGLTAFRAGGDHVDGTF